jgi:hypothetical protein
MTTPTQTMLIEAYKRGRAWHPAPEFANLHNLDEGRIAKMDGTEADAKLLVRSLQLSDIHYDDLVALFYKGRQPDYDGEVGPATRDLLKIARCAIPDFAPPTDARFHYDDPELQAAVESYQRFKEAYTGGSGSWPKGCDPDHKDVHSVVVRIDTSNASSHQKGIMDDVLRYVEETEAEIGQHVRHVVNGTYDSPQHDVKFQFIAGGVIGFAYFPRPDSCNQTVTARIDNSFNASLPVLAELLTHEYKGHSDGLEHSRGGIMNPSIGSPSRRASWIDDPHEKTKTRYFGGEPIPMPGPPPTPGDVVIDALEFTSPLIIKANGRMVMDGPINAKAKGAILKRLNVVPWPDV